MKPRSNSKQMGREIARLIGIAGNIKRNERNGQEREAVEDMPQNVSYWRGVAKKNADLLRNAQQEIDELKRRKLANFSLADIEAELIKRQQSLEDEMDKEAEFWRSTGRLDKSRR